MNTTINTTQPTKQPIGLPVLFFAELWERFGFYTMQALLVLYLVKVFLLSDDKAYGLFSAFSALVYATPVIGGYIADKFLGFRKAIFLGAILYIMGYFLLGLPKNPHFYLAMSLLIWGNGFFKSSVSSFLGTFYKDNDIRRDSGFTMFYMGINIGSFLGTFCSPLIANYFGWNYAFAAPGFGMIIGAFACLYGCNKYFPDKGLPPARSAINKLIFSKFTYEHGFLVVLLFLIGLCAFALHYETVVTYALIVFSVLTICYIFIISFFYQPQQRKKLWALIILIVFSIAFWALYLQTFMSLTLFIERNVDRHFFGWTILTAMYQAINPFFIIILSPLFAMFWLRLGKKKTNPSFPIKFVLGILFIGIGFLTLSLNINLASKTGIVASIWVVLMLFLQTCGELSLSPVGLSAVTSLSPPNLSGMLMGVWFLALAAAYAIAGKIADLTAIPQQHLNVAVDSAKIYGHNFLYFGIFAIIAALLLLVCTPFLNRMIESET